MRTYVLMRTRRIFERCAGEPATKTCKLCGLEKPIAEFEVRADSQRRRYFCAECRRAYQRRRWAEAHPPRPYAKRLRSAASLECTRCHERKPGTEFPRKRAGGELVQSWCTECYSTYNAERYRALRDTEI